VIHTEKMKVTIEGDILDRDGGNITLGVEAGKPAKVVIPESYSYIIGYNSPVYGLSGLRAKYGTYLFETTAKGEAEEGEEEEQAEKGCTIKLTTDSTLQELCYAIFTSRDWTGSAVVLDWRTGAVLALASYQGTGYRVGEIDEMYSEYVQHEGFFYQLGVNEREALGSTFKIFTASAAYNIGHTDFTWTDPGYYKPPTGGTTVNNVGGIPYGTIGIETAFSRSVNTYFAHLAVDIGAPAMEEMAKGYLFNTDIELDFASMHPSFDLGDRSMNAIAQTGFGQGLTASCPLHLAMMVQSVANGGVMLKPYMIDTITLGEETLVGPTMPEQISTPLSPENADKVLQLMYGAGRFYGLTSPSGLVGAKSGTAQINVEQDRNHIYLVAVTSTCVVVLSRNNTPSGVYGQGLTSVMQPILNYLG